MQNAIMSYPIKEQLRTLPSVPGVYQYYDKENRILYIGKAKDLKKRIRSYFQKSHTSKKLKILVKKIARVDYLVVNTEYEALLLENTLIKKHQPPYNVQLKDDKTYPWICIKKEPFPRIFLTRELIKDGSQYYGPYLSSKTAYTLLSLIRDLYALRSCPLDLSSNKIAKEKYKVCLEYHIKNCKGPCQGFQSEKDYRHDIAAAREIIRGNFQEPLREMQTLMSERAIALDFERAQEIKEKIKLLERYQARSTVVHPSIDDVDVFSIVSDPDSAYVNFLKIVRGSVIQSHTIEIKKKLDETDEELLQSAIVNLRDRFELNSKEIYLPIPLGLELPQVKISVPKIGDKRKIVELSQRNAKYYRQDHLKQVSIIDPERHTQRLMAQMKTDLRLSQEPQHMECFDNSNIQGAYPAAACVVFKQGKPSKKDYRKFNIKTVKGPDDFASIEEIVYRRYRRLLDENSSLPQLIIIDGGKGQLNAALKSLERLNLRRKIAVLGIAKRLEELYFPEDPLPLYINKNSETLKVIQRMRDEAHRFGLSHHRNRRIREVLDTELMHIPGIGEKTVALLLKHFKSTKAVKKASDKILEQLIGAYRATKLKKYFQEQLHS